MGGGRENKEKEVKVVGSKGDQTEGDRTMTSAEVYQWSEVIGKQLPMLRYWQRIGLALFSLGVVLAWTLTHGILADADPLERAALTRGTRQNFSRFRLGIRALARCRSLARMPFWNFHFRSEMPSFYMPTPIHPLSVVY